MPTSLAPGPVSRNDDSYEAWREGDYDDLVRSVALACWVGKRFLRKPKLARVYAFWAARRRPRLVGEEESDLVVMVKVVAGQGARPV